MAPRPFQIGPARIRRRRFPRCWRRRRIIEEVIECLCSILSRHIRVRRRVCSHGFIPTRGTRGKPIFLSSRSMRTSRACAFTLLRWCLEVFVRRLGSRRLSRVRETTPPRRVWRVFHSLERTIRICPSLPVVVLLPPLLLVCRASVASISLRTI